MVDGAINTVARIGFRGAWCRACCRGEEDLEDGRASQGVSFLSDEGIPVAAGGGPHVRTEVHRRTAPARGAVSVDTWARHSSDPLNDTTLLDPDSPRKAASMPMMGRLKRSATGCRSTPAGHWLNDGMGPVTRRGRVSTRAPVQSSDLEVSERLSKLLNLGSELSEATDDGVQALGQRCSNSSIPSKGSPSKSGVRAVLAGMSLMPRLKGKLSRSPSQADKALDSIHEAADKGSGGQHEGVEGVFARRQHELDVAFDQDYDVYYLSEKKVRAHPMAEENVFHHRTCRKETRDDLSRTDSDSDHSTSSTGSRDTGRSGRSRRSDASSSIPSGHELSTAVSQISMSQTPWGQQVIATWGVVVGKLLHSKVLNFSDIASETLHKKRYGTVAASVLGSVRQRARLVVEQAVKMAKFVGREKEDKLDSQWQIGDGSLKRLFSDQYVDTLALLANAARKICAVQPILAEATVPVRVFGDIHGQLRDLLLFFWAFGSPYEHSAPSFVFNGDFVDRGAHQLEVVGVLLALKCLLPEKVWLVRGNHEDRSMNRKYGFADECTRRLGSEMGPKLFDTFHNAFEQLPVACLIQGSVLVVHGGIGDGNWKLSELHAVRRPLRDTDLADPQNSRLFNLLWSDPIEDDDKRHNVFGVHSSPRGGMTINFGWNVTKTFCARNGLSLIVRSHQSKRGSLGFDIMHENLLVRVFTARDYEGQGNDGAALLIDEQEHVDSTGTGKLIVRPQVLQSLAKGREELPGRTLSKTSNASGSSGGSVRRTTPRARAAKQLGETAPPGSHRS